MRANNGTISQNFFLETKQKAPIFYHIVLAWPIWGITENGFPQEIGQIRGEVLLAR